MASTLHTRFTADDSGLRSALGRARSGLMGMGGGLTQINRLASGIILADVIRRSIRAMRAFIGETINAAAEISVLRTQIGLLEKDADAGAEIVDMIKEFSLRTSQSVDEIGKLYAGMRAFTDTRGQAEGMVEAMLDLSAVFPGLTANMSKASYNVGQLARGIGTSIDIREFARSGMNFNAVLEAMSTNTGMVIKDYKDYKKMLEAGKLTTEDFYQAIFSYADEFEGAAEQMVKNWKGFTAVLANTKAVIADELIGKSLDLFGRFGSQALAQFQERFLDSGRIKDMGTELARSVEAGLQGAISTFDIDFPLFAGDSSELFPDGMEVSDHPAFQMMENLGAIINQYGSFVVEYFKTLTGVLLGVKLAMMAISLTPVMLLAALILGSIAGLVAYKTEMFGVKEAVDNFTNTSLTFLLEKIGLLQAWIAGIVEKFMLWTQGGSTLAATIRGLIELFTNIATVLAGVFGPILEAVGNIIRTFIIPALQTAWTLIKTGIRLVLSIANVAFQIWLSVMRIVWAFIKTYLLPVFRVVWSFIKAKMIPVIDKAKARFDKIRQAINAVVGIVRGLIAILNELARKIANMKLPKWLTPGSPTPFELGLRGINKEVTRANRIFGQGPFAVGNGGLTTGINQNSIVIHVSGAGDPEAVATAISKKLGNKLRSQGMSHAHV
jgi:hypothetical protein